jgi:hypothetical protein
MGCIGFRTPPRSRAKGIERAPDQQCRMNLRWTLSRGSIRAYARERHAMASPSQSEGLHFQFVTGLF